MTRIGNGAFRDCSGFTDSLIISENVTTIGNEAFCWCRFTGTLNIPDSVTTIGTKAFYGCKGFEGSLVIPDSVTTIGDIAFYNCSGFTGSLILPDSITYLSRMAFNGCKNIQSAYFCGDIPTNWGKEVFSNMADNFTIYYPEGNTSGWTSPTWTAPDGTVYNTEAVPGWEKNVTYVIMEEVAPDELGDLYGENYPTDHWPEVTSGQLLKGTVAAGFNGESHCWENGTANAAKAFDGDPETFFDPFDANTRSWCGMLLNQPYRLTEIRILPRQEWEERTAGAAIQGSNDGYVWNNIVYITGVDTAPAGSNYHCFTPENNETYIQNYADIGYQDMDLSVYWVDNGAYRYYRYVNLEGNHGDVAEIELYGIPESAITTTWDTSALTLAAGDTYAFSGRITSLEPLDKLHISVVRADNTSVGIDYYRETEIGGTTFDLSAVPSITAGTLLTGLQVTNNQEELSLSNGSYLIRMWITDTAGNYLDGLTKMITVTDVSAAPVVEMLPVTEITASTAKLQAKIVDAKGGIIVDFGFNMYDTETGGERHAQYRAKQTDPKYQTDPYYQTAEYDPETGIFTVILRDHNPNRTYYAEGFAVYYQGDTPVTGFTPERTGFTTAVAKLNITSPKAYEVLSSAEISVTGSIDCKVDGITFADPILTVYDYQMAEVASVDGILNDDNTFSAEIDLSEHYAGTYSITVSADASNGSSVVSAPVSFNIPGKLAVYTDPVDESKITATKAIVTGRVPDTMGETLVYYGFHIFDESGNPLGSYFDGHDDESRWTTDFDPATGVITGEIPAEPGTTLYYSAFASYKTGGVQIDSFASTRESFTTKCVDITLDKINSYDGLSYKLDETAPYIKFHGHISNIADGHTFGNPQLVVTDSKGKLIESAEVELNGNEFTAEFDMSAYEVGVYTITAQITDDTGRVSYSNIKMVEMPKKCTEIVFKTNLGGEVLAQDEVHTIAHHYWLVVDAELDTGRSDIAKIEWETSSTDGLPIVPWNESEKYFDTIRPQTCQFNAAKKGSYTVTAKVTNHDGTVVSGSLDIMVKPATTLTFIDYSTLLPIEGVNVTISSEYECTTNELGQAIFYDLPEQLLYIVSAYKLININGNTYNTVFEAMQLEYGSNNTIMMFNSDIDVYSVKMTATQKSTDKTTVLYDETDIMLSSAVLNISNKNVTFDLDITYNPQSLITEYRLVQAEKTKATSKKPEFKELSPSEFDQNAKVELWVYSGTNKISEIALQLKFNKSGLDVSDSTNTGSISFGEGISVKIPDVLPVIGGMEINADVGTTPYTFYRTPTKIMVGIGFEKSIFGSDSDDEPDSLDTIMKNFDESAALIAELADDLKNGGVKAFSEHLNLQKHLAAMEPQTSIFKDMIPKIKVFGTASLEFLTKTLEYNLIVTVTSSFNKDFEIVTTLPVPIILNINGSIQLSAGMDFSFTFDNIVNDILTKEILDVIFEHITKEITLSLGVNFGLGIGPGIKIANVTGNGLVGLTGTFVLSTKYSSVVLTLDFYVRAKLLAFEFRKEFYKQQWLLKEGVWGEDYATAVNSNVLYSSSSYSLADRSYLDYTSDWYEPQQNAVLFSSFGNNDYTTETDTLMTYIYPDTQLQTVQTEDDKVMIWLTDDATRSSANRTKLVYSVYNELTGKWTTPQSVSDDGTLDSYPYLATDGANIWAAWVNMNTALTDDMTLDTGMLHSEICVAMFDPQTMSFRQVTALTANDVIDLNPKIAVSGDTVAAAWVSNDSGDLWGTSGTNTIYLSIYEDGSWSDVQAVRVLDRAVSNMEIGFVDGTLSAAYCLDTDNSFDTTDDIAVYVIVPGTGEEYLLTADGLNSNIQYVTIAGEQRLTWYSDGSIRYISTFGGESQDLLNGVMVTGGYRIVSDINGTVILKTVPMDGYSELYVSVYDEDDDSWSNDIRLTYQNSAYINDFGAMVEENGDITVIYTSEIEDMAQMCSGTIGFVKDISLDSVSHNSSDAVPGQMTKLYADVTNHGIADVESVLFRMKKDEAVLCETNVPLSLKAGKTVSVEVPMTVPESVGITEYEIEIVLPDAEEIDLSNNIGTVEFGHGNLSLYVSDMYGENSRLLTFEVINNGGYAADPVITVRKDTEDQAVVDVIELEELSGKSSVIVSYVLTNLEDSVYIELTSDREEYYTGDNVVYYSLESMTVSDLHGDINGDGIVSAKDAQYLADHLTSPDEYPVNTEDTDFNGDGEVNRADALYLLRHTILPERYPLSR